MDSSDFLRHVGGDFTRTTHSAPYPAVDPSTVPDLAGRSVFITGAASVGGLGRATAFAFAQAGASLIALGDIQPWDDLESELKLAAAAAGKPPLKILLMHLDVTNIDSVRDAANLYKAEVGGSLDILINNAGFLAPYLPLLETNAETNWKPWEINMHGTLNVTRMFLPMLLAKEDGLKININVASMAALTAVEASASYATSKLAVLRFTEVLSLDYQDQGVLAFCIHPGGLRTQLATAGPQAWSPLLNDEPELPAATLAWLCHERPAWLAGRYVSCNWDMEELMSKKDEIVQGDKLKMKMVF